MSLRMPARHLGHFELLVGGADEGRRDRHISSSGQSNDDLWQNWLRERRPPTLIL
jgi:hypothetical protein